MTTFSLLCAVFDMFKGKVICRPIHLDAPAKIYTSCLPLEIYFHSKNVLCFFFVCVQRRRRKQTSPSTRKGRQWRCTHSPGEKDRGARKGTFLCIYHQDGAACPTYSFSHRFCPKQHIWPELFDLVDCPRTHRVQFLPQSVDILNRHCLSLEAEMSTFHPVSDGFLLSFRSIPNDRCRFRLSQSWPFSGRHLCPQRFYKTARDQTPCLLLSNVSILSNPEPTRIHCHILILNFISAWGPYPNSKRQ